MVLIQSIVIFKKKEGYILKIITKVYVTRNDDTKDLHSTMQILDDTISFCYMSLITILVVMMMMMRRRRRRGRTVMLIWMLYIEDMILEFSSD